MSRNEDDNDLSSLRLPSAVSTRRSPTVVTFKPEQVISRPDRLVFDAKKVKLEGGVTTDINQIGPLIVQWPNWGDVWPFRLGLPILGIACGATGFFLNSRFRNVLYLEHYSRLSSYAAMAGLPAFASALIHGLAISTNILQRNTGCPVCQQVQSAAIQLVFGLGIPVLSAPMISYGTAAALKDVHFPNIKKQPRAVWDFTKQVYKPIRGQLGVIGAAQVILAMGITYFEQECYYSKILPVLEGKKTFKKYSSEEGSMTS